MKTPVYLSILVMFTLFAISCTKTSLSELNGNNGLQNQNASLESSIFRSVNEPFEAELGTPSAMFREGDELVIYVPYLLVNDLLTESTISMIDNATGLEIEKLDLVSSADPVAYQLNKPVGLLNDTFMFVRFTANNNYTNKSVSIVVSLNGSVVSNQISMENAFSVVP